eukprot:scaffold1012_cov418-Prasinococcus_capsulatus_cf.AAC.10
MAAPGVTNQQQPATVPAMSGARSTSAPPAPQPVVPDRIKQDITRVDLSGPLFSIDVECVATGKEHNARAVAQIALVNAAEQPVLNLYVKPAAPVESYLTPLTGLTKEILDKYGTSFEEALAILKQHLPRNAVICGQNIRSDIQWLQLTEEDYGSLIDLAGPPCGDGSQSTPSARFTGDPFICAPKPDI